MRSYFIGTGILVATIGLMMLIAPEACVKVIVILIGISSIVNGFYNLIEVRKMIQDLNFRIVITVRGIVAIIVGLAAVMLPMVFAGTVWTIMIYALAVYLLFSAGMEIYGAMKMKSAGVHIKAFTVEIIGSVVLAIILFAMPAAIGVTIIRIIGAFVMVGGFGFIVWSWQNKHNIRY